MALSVDGEVMAELNWRSDRNHSVELVPTMRRLMGHAGADMQGLRAVFVAGGPGGFSALRVGMSTAKTLADSLEIPLVSVGTLDIEARPYLGLGVPVCALIEAGKSRLYVGRYEADKGGTDYEVVEYEELGPPVDSETLFCGEAVTTRADVLRDRLGESRYPSEGPAADAAAGRPRRAGAAATGVRQDGRSGHSSADILAERPGGHRRPDLAAKLIRGVFEDAEDPYLAQARLHPAEPGGRARIAAGG